MSKLKKTKSEIKKSKILPLLPLRDVVVYPHMVIPLFVGRKKSIQALEEAMDNNKQVVLSAQKHADKDEPTIDDIHSVGTVATVLQLLKLPDGTVKVLVEGVNRARIAEFFDNKEHFAVEIESFDEESLGQREGEILVRSLLVQFEQYVKLNKKIPPEILTSLSGISDVSRLGDTIAAHMTIKLDDKQKLLEIESLQERLEKLMGYLESEIDIIQLENKIRGSVKRQLEKNQREYYLNEQKKAIERELGELDVEGNELEDFEKRINESGMPKEAVAKARAELNKLKLMSPMSAEAAVSRNYLDWVIRVPWKKRSKVHYDLGAAQSSLDEDHYGLSKVKERIIEYLAVQQRVKKLKGPVLCLVGPPGVGKTSLGQSIAKATGRKFVRMSLGGVRDEAEIRGHRRTYIGALPGKILQKLSKVGVRNPLFLLDEVDKMAMDFRGDPASALLEVLDPEQNHTFNDHYLELDYDLSEVMFIATANTMDIPPALMDRMEVIRLSGYTEEEKVNIAQRHLIKKQKEANGLLEEELDITPHVLRDLIRYYTREAGVRGLERDIAKICRKTVKQLIEVEEKAMSEAAKGAKTKSKAKATKGKAKTKAKAKSKAKPEIIKTVISTAKQLEKFLGVRRHRYGLPEEYNQVGQVNGLAWTEVGGDLLTIEAVTVEGKGETIYTGQLGDVMQESIKAALTVVRSRCGSMGITRQFFEKNNIHIHVPEGATPKDGPSAGISMATALVSVITKIPIRCDVAMTGEITLRGEVLPIGGLKEKLLAALRAKIKMVIIPEENERDLKEIPKDILKQLDIRPVKWIDEVWMLALEKTPMKTKAGAKPRGKAGATKTPASKATGKGKRGRNAGRDSSRIDH